MSAGANAETGQDGQPPVGVKIAIVILEPPQRRRASEEQRAIRQGEQAAGGAVEGVVRNPSAITVRWSARAIGIGICQADTLSVAAVLWGNEAVLCPSVREPGGGRQERMAASSSRSFHCEKCPGHRVRRHGRCRTERRGPHRPRRGPEAGRPCPRRLRSPAKAIIERLRASAASPTRATPTATSASRCLRARSTAGSRGFIRAAAASPVTAVESNDIADECDAEPCSMATTDGRLGTGPSATAASSVPKTSAERSGRVLIVGPTVPGRGVPGRCGAELPDWASVSSRGGGSRAGLLG